MLYEVHFTRRDTEYPKGVQDILCGDTIYGEYELSCDTGVLEKPPFVLHLVSCTHDLWPFI